MAARGIDVDNVTHVVNYECPDDEKTYLHRIGRTGRAGHSGTAVTFVDWEDIARWQMIDRALKLPFKDPVETYSTSDHVFTGLNIPAGTTGTLPKAARTREGLAAEKVEDLGETGKKKHADHGDRHGDRDHGSDRGRGRSEKPRGDKPPRRASPRQEAPRQADGRRQDRAADRRQAPAASAASSHQGRRVDRVRGSRTAPTDPGSLGSVRPRLGDLAASVR